MFPGAARQRATAKGPAHAREAAGPEAAERARLGREREGQAHGDAAAIAIPAGAALRMLRRPAGLRRASAAPGGPAIEPRRRAARASPPGRRSLSAPPPRTLGLPAKMQSWELPACGAFVLSAWRILIIHFRSIYCPPTKFPPGAPILMGVGDRLYSCHFPPPSPFSSPSYLLIIAM